MNQIIRWTDRGIELEADPRHAEIVVRELGLEGATPSKVPGVKLDGDTDKLLPGKVRDGMTSIGQTNIDNGAARTLKKNRQKAFSKCIWEGIQPKEAKAWIDGLSTKG